MASTTFLRNLKSAVFFFDQFVTRTSLRFSREKGTLLTFVFHSIFLPHELNSEIIDPQQGMALPMFRNLIQHFQANSYIFVSPQDLLRGLDPARKYALITFDDGYFNNLRALPVMEEFGVPAVFFISASHVKYRKAYWWDVVFRELRKRGRSEKAILDAIIGFKRLRTQDVETRLKAEFGEQSLEPIGDLDRPLNPEELCRLARHALVHLGNHTRNHAILTNYSLSEAKAEIQGAQDDIRQMIGMAPVIIAYPNGNYSPSIMQAAQECGLRLGLTVEPGKNRLPIQSAATLPMRLKRFMPSGGREMDVQCRSFRAAISLYRLARATRNSMYPQSG